MQLLILPTPQAHAVAVVHCVTAHCAIVIAVKTVIAISAIAVQRDVVTRDAVRMHRALRIPKAAVLVTPRNLIQHVAIQDLAARKSK